MEHHRLIAPKSSSEGAFLQGIADIQNRIARRAYELFASSGFKDGHDLEDWLVAESEVVGKMPLELKETDKELTVTAGLPGFNENDIEIRVEPRRLFITGKQEEKSEDKKKGEIIYSERSNEVFRTIDLPVEIDPDKVKATLHKGELEITMPKKEIGKKVVVERKAA